MATSDTPYRVLSLLGERRAGDGARVFIRVRRALDIGAFGAGAIYQAKAGEEVVNEHDELGPGADYMQSLLGRGDEALEALRVSVETWPQFRENARTDDDLAALREEPRFVELVG